VEQAAQTQRTAGGLFKHVALIWFAVAALVCLINLGGILSGRFPGPDDAMRLLQVRDLLEGQAWFDLHQYRVDAAKGPESGHTSGGVLMHWSRLVDVPLALIIGALTPLLGSATAEAIALVLVPLLTLLAAMLLTARLVRKLLSDDLITLTCIAMVLSVPLLFQFSPMRIDHHGWQIVAGLIAVNSIFSRSAVKGGLIAGSAMAVWLSISLEGLPLAASICALMAWRWWIDRRQRAWLAWVMAGLAGGSVLAYVATKNTAGLVTLCDAIGPAHIAMFAWGAGVLGALARFNPANRLTLLAGFAAAGGGALAILLSWAPECAGSSFARLNPVLIAFWYEGVSEGLPIWHQSLDVALPIIIFPLLGIFASAKLAKNALDARRTCWREYTALLIAAFVIAMLVARAGAMAAALAAVPMGWQISEWLRRIRESKRPARRAGGMVLLIMALAPALPAKAVTKIASVVSSEEKVRKGSIPKTAEKVSSCNIDANSEQLAALPKGEIFAPLDISPDLLLYTPHSVIATGHHRGEKGMVFVIETALGSSAQARKAMLARGVRYVAACPDLHEIALYAQARPDGFAADLSRGNAPDWLEPLALESESGLKFWRVKPE
jgi:hypothetical protein